MALQKLSTSHTLCDCGGSLSTGGGKEFDAYMYGFDGVQKVRHATKRCSVKSCRSTYAYNFKWSKSSRVNTVKLDDVDVLFVTDKTCFKKDYLAYHETLQFRGYLSSRAIAFAGAEHLFEGDGVMVEKRIAVMYMDARFLMLAMQEFEQLGDPYLYAIKVGEEVTEADVKAYDVHLHSNAFPAPSSDLVRELACDGHEKVMKKIGRCGALPTKRAGKPRKNRQAPVPYGNGWFMVSDPRTGRVLAVEEQFEPENMTVVLGALTKALQQHENVNCILYDRACMMMPQATGLSAFKGIKYYCVDKWHAKKHNKKCACNPGVHRRLKMRLKSVNTSVAEQVFSWFRGFARTFNELRPARHHFLVLYYCRKHNKMIEDRRADYLNKHSHMNTGRRSTQGYACGSLTCMRKSNRKPSAKPLKKKVVKKTVIKRPAARKA